MELTREQIIAGLIAAELERRKIPLDLRACACMGSENGEPLCICAMGNIRAQAEAIMAQASRRGDGRGGT